MDEIPQNQPVQTQQAGTPSSQNVANTTKTGFLSFLNSRLNGWNYFIGSIIFGLVYLIIGLTYIIFTRSSIEDLNNNYLLIISYLLHAPLLVRRLHDIGRSGWWAIAVYIAWNIPLLNLIATLYLLIKKGDSLPNKYGAPDNTDADLKHLIGI